MGNDFGVTAVLFEDFALFDTESVLFIDDDESEIRELDRVLDQGMRSENYIRLSVLQSFASIFLHPRCEGSDEEVRSDIPFHEPGFIAREMLSSEDLGRSHNCSL